ncbi:6490_t:CDS:1 [Scutellospora calospora]|uniref:6490_t:CDS:1 n=1 Tax=Scutellospora calospora TaxID=85575 RepID=A0ACA9LRA0_9GLOM|nr:6490_t:CDS:1 [Scutellospora calospora]
MANLYEKVMAELLGHNENNIISDHICAPYDPLQNYQAQVAITYQSFLQSKRTGNQRAQLWYAYYLGKILENIPPEQRTACIKQLIRYYTTATVRTYYIFRKWGTSLIDKTTNLTVPMIYGLKKKDYQSIINYLY